MPDRFVKSFSGSWGKNEMDLVNDFLRQNPQYRIASMCYVETKCMLLVYFERFR